METKIATSKINRERWFTLSLVEQLAHIGSEVGRARKWQGKDEQSFWGAVGRACKLFDFTQTDLRWVKQRRELDRVRESFADAVLGGSVYHSTLTDLECYFMPFALLIARRAAV